jgi:hypothetical protein
LTSTRHALVIPGVILCLLWPAPADTRQAARVLVRQGDDLQAAIDRAQPGDLILLQPGATFTGNFRLRRTTGTGEITIRSAVPPFLMPRGSRVRPPHARWMATLRSGNTRPALATDPGAHHWRVQWIAFDANTGGLGDIITLGEGGAGQNDSALVPHDLTLEGLIIRGDPRLGQKRAIALNSASTIVRYCDIRDIKAIGQDNQAIAGWNGPGPFLIESNYLEAAGENILFGGADPSIRDLVPSDITIRDNYVTKPLDWREAGARWTVKNLLELKNAQRVVIEHNVFEHSWRDAQTGFALLFHPTNQGGRAPWSVVSDVRVERNIIRHAGSGISITGRDSGNVSARTMRLQISHNLLYDIDSKRWGGRGAFLQIGGDPAELVVDHNTVIHDGPMLLMHGNDGGARAIDGLQLTNNLALHNAFGIIGEGAGLGSSAIAAYTTRSDVRGNAIAGASESRYPAGNLFPDVDELFAQFVAPDRADYRLRSTSRLRRGATDGTMIGADVAGLFRRLGTLLASVSG